MDSLKCHGKQSFGVGEGEGKREERGLNLVNTYLVRGSVYSGFRIIIHTYIA
jgi:hypothetical protein